MFNSHNAVPVLQVSGTDYKICCKSLQNFDHASDSESCKSSIKLCFTHPVQCAVLTLLNQTLLHLTRNKVIHLIKYSQV